MELSENLKKYLMATADTITAHSYAEKKARDLYGNDGNGGWLSKEDAARHLLGIGELSRNINPSMAKGIGYLYEFLTGSASNEDLKMDLHNNNLALSLFNAKSREDLTDRVKKLMENASYQDFSNEENPVYLKQGKPK